jgi:hypothetical protein
MKKETELRYHKLRESCFKLRSLQHLLANQEDSPFSELDEGDIWYGLGLLLKEIHDDVLQVAREVEAYEIRKAKKS